MSSEVRRTAEHLRISEDEALKDLLRDNLRILESMKRRLIAVLEAKFPRP